MNTMKSFIKCTKDLLGENKIQFLIISFIILFLILTILLGFYSWIVIFKVYTSLFIDNIIKPLSFDLKTPFIFFFFILLLTLVICIICSLIQEHIFKRKPKNNYHWIIFSFLIFAFLIIFGLCFISQTYGGEFSQDLPWNYHNKNDWDLFKNNPNCSISKLKCSSKYNNFVIEEEVECVFDYNLACPIKLNYVVSHKVYKNNNTPFESFFSPGRGVINFNVNENIEKISLNILILKNSSSNPMPLVYRDILISDKYTREEYHQKEHNKAFAIITLISISLFSTIIAMNNLRQLIEEKEDN